jgi:hypothetical protein
MRPAKLIAPRRLGRPLMQSPMVMIVLDSPRLVAVPYL